MKSILQLIFLLLVSATVFGQTENLILTKDQNNRWLDSLRILPLDQQLNTIKQRLLSDTIVFVNYRFLDIIKAGEQIENKIKGDGKPFIIISGCPMIMDNTTKPKRIIALTELLTIKHIKTVHILSPSDPATTALFGYAALDGVIMMTLAKKKYAKLFRYRNHNN